MDYLFRIRLADRNDATALTFLYLHYAQPRSFTRALFHDYVDLVSTMLEAGLVCFVAYVADVVVGFIWHGVTPWMHEYPVRDFCYVLPLKNSAVLIQALRSTRGDIQTMGRCSAPRSVLMPMDTCHDPTW